MHANECATICLNNRVTSKMHFPNWPKLRSDCSAMPIDQTARWEWTAQHFLLRATAWLEFNQKNESNISVCGRVWCQESMLGVNIKLSSTHMHRCLTIMRTSTKNLTHSFICMCDIYKTKCQDFNTIIYDFGNADERNKITRFQEMREMITKQKTANTKTNFQIASASKEIMIQQTEIHDADRDSWCGRVCMECC